MKRFIMVLAVVMSSLFFSSNLVSAQLITHDGISMIQGIVNSLKEIEQFRKILETSEKTRKIIEEGSKLSKIVKTFGDASDLMYISMLTAQRVNEIQGSVKDRYKYITAEEMNSVRSLLNVALLKNKDLPIKIQRIVGGSLGKGSNNMNDKERLDLIKSAKKEMQDIYNFVNETDNLLSSISYNRQRSVSSGVLSIFDRKKL